MTDQDIWPLVREAAARHGWNSPYHTIPAAVDDICERFGVEDRDGMRERVTRLWDETLRVMGQI